MFIIFFMKYPVHNFFPIEANYYCNKQRQYAQKEIHLLKIQWCRRRCTDHLVKGGKNELSAQADLVNPV